MATSLIRPIAVNVNTGAVTYEGGVTADVLSTPLGWGSLSSGKYYFPMGQGSTGLSTAATLGVGTLRLYPWYVPNSATVSSIGAEVTTVGEAGSKFRLGIYSDNGSSYPGSLVVDAGTIAGDSGTVQELAVSAALTPGLYWIGGAVQVVSVTQPTMRSLTLSAPFPMATGTSVPAAGGTTSGYQQASVTGALPASFTASVTSSGAAPRTFVKIA